MSNSQSEISVRVQAFAAELEELVKKAAMEAVAAALGVPGTGAPSRARVAAPRAAAAAPRARKGGKRPPAELAAMVDKTRDWVKANPGQGVEAMARSLGVQTKELALPINKLLKSKAIKKRGQKRATKYYPA